MSSERNPQAEVERSSRRAFHWSLGVIILPVFSLPFVWGLALQAWLRKDRIQPWAVALLLLAVLDTVISVGVVVSLDDVGRLETPEDRSSIPRYVVGITGESQADGTLAITQVRPESPAAAAGLEVGDLILEVDGLRVSSIPEVSRQVQLARDERPVSFRTERAGAHRTTDIVPRLAPSPSRQPTGIFENAEEGAGRWLRNSIGSTLSFVPVILVFCILLACAHLRGASAKESTRVAGLVGVLLLSDSVIALPIVWVTGGGSFGSMLITMAVRCCVVTLLGWRLMNGQPESNRSPTSLSRVRTFLLSVFYGLAFLVRLVLLMFWVVDLEDLGRMDSGPVGHLMVAPVPFWGRAAFIFVVVILGPVAEEVLFRGVLLSWARSWMKDATAIVATALLFALIHPQYGLGMGTIFVYGLIFAWARIKSGDLVVPILLHVLMNGFATLLALL